MELKNRIEKNIKDKFNETSDVLNIIDWSDAPTLETDENGDYGTFKGISPGDYYILFTYPDGQTYKSTITVECKSKYLKIDKNLFAKLNIWDTCGAEIFRAVTKQYYRGADAAIVIFDLTEQNTFNDLKKWLKDIKNCGDKNIQILIVGNKLDLVGKRKVTQSQAMNFCKDNGYKYIEASAKDGTNVLRIFEEVTSDLANRHQKQKEKEINEKYKMKTLEIMDNNVVEKNKKGCC